MTGLWRCAAVALLLVSANGAALAGEFVTGWRPPKGMNNFDLRIAATPCEKRARQTKGSAVAREAVFENCMRALGATLVHRSRNGWPANGPINR